MSTIATEFVGIHDGDLNAAVNAYRRDHLWGNVAL